MRGPGAPIQGIELDKYSGASAARRRNVAACREEIHPKKVRGFVRRGHGDRPVEMQQGFR